MPTADGRVLPGGTAYITDVGMTGARGGVIGVKKEQSIAVMRTQMPMRYETSDVDPWLMEFVIWLVPLWTVAWWRGQRAAAALCVGATVLTLIEFPRHYFDLVFEDGTVIALVAARNALLVSALAVLLTRLAAPARSPRPAAGGPRSAPARP